MACELHVQSCMLGNQAVHGALINAPCTHETERAAIFDISLVSILAVKYRLKEAF